MFIALFEHFAGLPTAANMQRISFLAHPQFQ